VNEHLSTRHRAIPNIFVRSRIAWVLLAAITLSAAVAVAHDTASKSDEAPPAKKHPNWAPPSPSPTEYDWIQLNTKEWLKGKIELIQDDSVTFDSDKLHELTFDWDDIILLVTAKEHTFRFTGRRTVRGTGEMRADIIRIRTGDEVKEFKRSELVGMIPGTGRERDYWSGNVGLGLAGQAGNTSQLSLTGTLLVTRETTFRKVNLLYNGNIATQDGDISANTHRMNSGVSFYFTRKFFIDVPRIEFFQDEFQNIKWRITPTAGVGYDVIQKKKITWRVGAAAGFQAVNFYSVDSGSDRSNDFPILVPTNLVIDIKDRFKWTNFYQLQLVTTNIGNSNQHLTSTLSFDFWGPLDFDNTFQWDWVAKPQADADGSTPKSSDFRISVGFSIKL
jgi:hypothetical protein